MALLHQIFHPEPNFGVSQLVLQRLVEEKHLTVGWYAPTNGALSYFQGGFCVRWS